MDPSPEARVAAADTRPSLHRQLANRVALTMIISISTTAAALLTASYLGLSVTWHWVLLGCAVLLSMILLRNVIRTIGDQASAPLLKLAEEFSEFSLAPRQQLPELPPRTVSEIVQLYQAYREMAARLQGSTQANQRLQGDLEVVTLARDELDAVNSDLEKLAAFDGLTGLVNRRTMDQRLDEAWQHGLRSASPVTLLMMDVDHFKHYNDSYGHPAGDACLQAVANVLRNAAQRSIDTVARYGGEEFCIILPSVGLSKGAALAANILEEVRMLKLAAAPAVGGGVSISIGVASLTPRSGMLAEILLQQADSALYEAKRNGRDQLVLAGSADGDAINDPDAPPADRTQPSRAG